MCLQSWVSGQVTAGITQITYPSGHDMVRGLRFADSITAGIPNLMLPAGVPMRFRSQDPITVAKIGSAVAGDRENMSMLMFYEDLPGVDAHLINMATLRRRGVNQLTIEDSITASAGGIYATPRALTASSDLLKANTEYALLGIATSVTKHAITLRGPDTGNMRVGVPGILNNRLEGLSFFGNLSDAHDLPCIPVLNSANRNGTFVEVLDDENVAAVRFSLALVELAPGTPQQPQQT